jgi:hypothetical protein
VYAFRGRTIRGRDAIIASYAAAHAEASATYDAVAYESAVRADSGGDDPERSAIVRFVDLLTKAGRTHRHECEQRITVDPHADPPAQVVRIEHVDLPGEREALNAFHEAVGLPSRGPIT